MLPVSDVDRTRDFYAERVGFVVDHDQVVRRADPPCVRGLPAARPHTCRRKPLRREQANEPPHPGHLRRPRPAGAVVLLARRTGLRAPRPPGVDLPEDADPLAAWDDFLARVGVPEEQRNTRSAIEDPDGQGPRLFFQQVPERKVVKNRVHLDVRAAPGLQGEERMAALEVECDRLVALGATRLRRYEPAPPMSAGFIVMTDPEGNEFCLD
jgi:catechol 2,3-dioxygenase-like lactoylglutathione lyase family enzyme